MRLRNGSLLTWFGSFRHSPHDRGFLVGGSLGGPAEAPLPGRQRQHRPNRAPRTGLPHAPPPTPGGDYPPAYPRGGGG